MIMLCGPLLLNARSPLAKALIRGRDAVLGTHRLEDVAFMLTESCERRPDLWSRFGPPPQVELGRCLEL